MVGSAFTAPHVTEWVDVDVTATMDLIRRLKKDREFPRRQGHPLLVLAKATCLGIRRNPDINATWDEAAQRSSRRAMSTSGSTPRAVSRAQYQDADLLTMRGVGGGDHRADDDRARGADATGRHGGRDDHDHQYQVFGIDSGTPILNPGSRRSSRSARSPADRGWSDPVPSGSSPGDDAALSFDHRLVDGELGSRYLADVAAILADPARTCLGLTAADRGRWDPFVPRRRIADTSCRAARPDRPASDGRSALSVQAEPGGRGGWRFGAMEQTTRP